MSISPPKKMNVKQMLISELIPYANNARTHTPKQINQIARSIEEFGFNNPVLIDGKNEIIAGHGRVLAAQQLGMDTVPVIELSHLSNEQKRAYVIADNQLALQAGWDNELLSLELGELNALNFDLSLLGFGDVELSGLLPVKEGLTDDDAVPEAPETPITVEGDIWMLGKHRVMCGDCTSTDAVDRLMDGSKADMVFTDPPWNVNYGDVEKGNAQGYKPRKIMNDCMSEEEWEEFCNGFASALYLATKSGGAIYCVMSAQEWPVVDRALREAGFHWSSSIIWAKDRLVLSRKDYHTQYEPIWYGWNANAPRISRLQDRKQSDVWNIDRPSKSDLHPTTKPVELVQRAVENSSKGEDIVLDLFGGSGSTLIACEKTRRNCYMMELDPRYCDVIVKRWEEYTGQVAEMVKTDVAA